MLLGLHGTTLMMAPLIDLCGTCISFVVLVTAGDLYSGLVGLAGFLYYGYRVRQHDQAPL